MFLAIVSFVSTATVYSPALAGNQGRLTDLDFHFDGQSARLDFKIKPRRGVVISIDRTETKVSSWKDDRGRDIGSSNAASYYDGATVSRMGWVKENFASIYGKAHVSETARRMTIRGEVKYLSGIGLRKGRDRRVKLEVGEEIGAGKYDFVVKKIESDKDVVGKKEAKVHRVSLELESDELIPDSAFVQKLRFASKDGR